MLLVMPPEVGWMFQAFKCVLWKRNQRTGALALENFIKRNLGFFPLGMGLCLTSGFGGDDGRWASVTMLLHHLGQPCNWVLGTRQGGCLRVTTLVLLLEERFGNNGVLASAFSLVGFLSSFTGSVDQGDQWGTDLQPCPTV